MPKKRPLSKLSTSELRRLFEAGEAKRIRAEALEEAARVAESYSMNPPSYVPTLIAEEIRALIETG